MIPFEYILAGIYTVGMAVCATLFMKTHGCAGGGFCNFERSEKNEYYENIPCSHDSIYVTHSAKHEEFQCTKCKKIEIKILSTCQYKSLVPYVDEADHTISDIPLY